MELAIGRVVHVKADESRCQPGIIVTVWPDQMINAVVFRDGSNDDRHDNNAGSLTRWLTSLHEGTGVGEFHDPRECDTAA